LHREGNGPRVQGSKFNVQQAVEKPSDSFDGAQDERNAYWNDCRKSVHAELVEACSAVFQQPVNVGTGVDALNLEP
jgi:hypothetical protein